MEGKGKKEDQKYNNRNSRITSITLKQKKKEIVNNILITMKRATLAQIQETIYSAEQNGNKADRHKSRAS